MLKFDWSSKAVILFCLLTIVLGVINKKINFKKQHIKKFFLLSAYFIVFILSIFYSSNQEESLKVIIQLSPLIIFPFIISFVDFQFNNKIKNNAITIFVFANITYSILILSLFISSEDIGNLNLIGYLRDYDKFQFKINENLTQKYFLVHKAYFSMGYVISAIYCLNLFFLSKSKYSFKSIFNLVVFVYFSFWIFYAFSFPNVIALLLCLVILLNAKLDKKFFIPFLTIMVLVCSLIFTLKSKEVDVERGLNFIKSAVTDSKYEINDSRQEIYKSYKRIFKNSSFTELLIGFGVGDVQDKLNDDYIKRLDAKNTKNLLFFSEEFNSSYWFKNNVTVLSNQLKAPDSALVADVLQTPKNSTTISHNISTKTFLEEKGTYTFSIYAKKGESSKLILRLGDVNQRAVFDLKEGLVKEKFNVVNSGMYQVNNDWFRCFITVNLIKDGLVLIGLSNDNAAYNFANEKDLSINLWGGQFEKGSLTDYKKRGKELLKYALDKKLNTHNNYLYFLMATGFIGLILFIISIGYLVYTSITKFDIIKLSFCIILSINFLTENILSRHWGLLFFAFMLMVLFDNKEKLEKQ